MRRFRGPDPRSAAAGAAVALLTLLPFLRGIASGAVLYFRDLSLQFLPLRRFALEGLARGELRFWNPYVHEGIPLSLPPIGYPVDLLQLLQPSERWISLLLLLHIPLAAVCFFAMLRGLGQGRTAAAAGAIVYGLGGFLLSTVNLYVYLEAAAWAPLVVLGLVRVGAGGRRRTMVFATVALALTVSTTGLELALQAVVIGLALGWPRAAAASRATRMALVLLLAAALAAPVLVSVGGQIAGSARGRGFATDVVLAHSVHPFTLVQTLVAGLYGDPNDIANVWWGQNFFPRGFPYMLSLYLGAATLAVAGVGVVAPGRWRGRLLTLALGAGFLCLGRWAGLAPVIDAIPLLRLVRYPAKAFFTVHFTIAVLAALGVTALRSDQASRSWRRLAAFAGALGALLASAAVLPMVAPQTLNSFAAAFFPPDFSPSWRSQLLTRVLRDAATGGWSALVLAAAAIAVGRQRLNATNGSWLAVGIVTADLIRAGAGLNPMVSPEFLRISPQLAAALPRLREGRVFTCQAEESEAYRAVRVSKPGAHELWTFATAIETLTPFSNVPLAVASALSPDLTMLVPEDRVPSPNEASCRDVAATVSRARAAAVGTVLSLDPLEHPDLRLIETITAPRIAPLALRAYRLAASKPFVELLREGVPVGRIFSFARQGDGVSIEIDAPSAGRLVLREGHAPGWRVQLDGRPIAIEPVEGHFMGLPVPPGRHAAQFRYTPPGLRLATLAAGVCLVLLLWLTASSWRRRDNDARR